MSDRHKTSPPIALEERESEDGRLFSPSAGRNKVDIAEALAELLPTGGRVLEIGSGTGEHGIETLSQRPDLKWQFSDPDEESRVSQAAWISHLELNQSPPLNLDMTNPEWSADIQAPFDTIFSANMIHIAPLEALKGIVSEAAKLLTPEGTIIFYGPFLFGEDSAPSNLKFDENLKRRNPTWGVREIESVKHIFAKQGFNRVQLRGMPKNNHILGLSRH